MLLTGNLNANSQISERRQLNLRPWPSVLKWAVYHTQPCSYERTSIQGRIISGRVRKGTRRCNQSSYWQDICTPQLTPLLPVAEQSLQNCKKHLSEGITNPGKHCITNPWLGCGWCCPFDKCLVHPHLQGLQRFQHLSLLVMIHQIQWSYRGEDDPKSMAGCIKSSNTSAQIPNHCPEECIWNVIWKFNGSLASNISYHVHIFFGINLSFFKHIAQ